jgi:hypothetical protein
MNRDEVDISEDAMVSAFDTRNSEKIYDDQLHNYGALI